MDERELTRRKIRTGNVGNNEDSIKFLNSITDLKEVSSTVHNERLVINNKTGEVISIEQLENLLNGNH